MDGLQVKKELGDINGASSHLRLGSLTGLVNYGSYKQEKEKAKEEVLLEAPGANLKEMVPGSEGNLLPAKMIEHHAATF